MFTVVMLQNDRLLYQAGTSDYSTWLPVLRASLIIYPVLVMTMLTAAQGEQGGGGPGVAVCAPAVSPASLAAIAAPACACMN